MRTVCSIRSSSSSSIIARWLLVSAITTGMLLDVTNGFSVSPASSGRMTTSVSAPTTSTSSSSSCLLQASPSSNNDQPPPQAKTTKSFQSRISTLLVATSLLLGSTFTNLLPSDFGGVQPAFAEGGSKVVGSLKGSGLVFKDTLQIERFEDPKIKGVVLYISNFDRPITEKLGGNFFNDPAYASVACAKTGKDVAIADNIQKGPQGEEVFEESRSLLFKTLRVQRIYDTESNTVVYVSYNTRFDKSDDTNKSRFKSSLCAVNLNDQ